MSFAIFEKWLLNILQTETGSLTTFSSSRRQMFRLLAEPLLRNGLMVGQKSVVMALIHTLINVDLLTPLLNMYPRVRRNKTASCRADFLQISVM